MIILITASLSSKMYNFVFLCENFAFEETKSRCDTSQEFCVSDCFFSDTFFEDGFFRSGLSFCFRFELECNTSIIKSQRSSAGILSIRNPASREIISVLVELCDTHICFLYIQLMGTNVCLPNTHNVPLDVDFESSRSPAKSESWNNPNRHCAVFPTWQYCFYSQVWWIYEINRFRRLSQALVHFVMGTSEYKQYSLVRWLLEIKRLTI